MHVQAPHQNVVGVVVVTLVHKHVRTGGAGSGPTQLSGP